MNTKRSVLVIVVAVVLLFSMVGMASALSQSWYMLETSSGATGADYEMQKDDGVGSSYVQIAASGFEIWAADQAVAVDGGINMDGTWSGNLYLYSAAAGSGSSVQVDIGVLSSGGGFTSMDSNSQSWGTTGLKNMALDFTLDDFVLAKDEYLALKVTNKLSTEWVRIRTEPGTTSPSYLTYSLDDPDYPVPEVSTLLLTSMGVLMLGGFIVYSRQKKKQ